MAWAEEKETAEVAYGHRVSIGFLDHMAHGAFLA